MTRGFAVALAITLTPPAQAQEEPYAVDDPLVEPPVRVAGEPPPYPAEARERCYEGTARLEALVEADGSVSRARIVEDQHYGMGEAARKAVYTWRYQPARLIETGKAVRAVVPISVRFTSPCGEQEVAAPEPLTRAGGEVRSPKKKSARPPEYTRAARDACIQGIVILEVIINTSGDVESTRILKDLQAGLGAAAVDAVRDWKFAPARLPNGQPIDVIYTLTVNFRHPGCDDPVEVQLNAIEGPVPDVGDLTGEITAALTISRRGYVTDIEIVSTTNDALIAPVRKGFYDWKFEPPRSSKTGRKTAASVTVTLRF